MLKEAQTILLIQSYHEFSHNDIKMIYERNDGDYCMGEKGVPIVDKIVHK